VDQALSIAYKVDIMCSCLPVCAWFPRVRVQARGVSPVCVGGAEQQQHYEVSRSSVEELALYLTPLSSAKGNRIITWSEFTWTLHNPPP